MREPVPKRTPDEGSEDPLVPLPTPNHNTFESLKAALEAVIAVDLTLTVQGPLETEDALQTASTHTEVRMAVPVVSLRTPAARGAGNPNSTRCPAEKGNFNEEFTTMKQTSSS